MKKIMFNDRFGLTEAVLKGNKTMTRRLVGNRMTEDDIAAYLKGYKDVAYNLAHYKIGEVVAVAQSYEDLGYSPTTIQRGRCVRKSIHGDNPGWTEDMIGQIGDWYIDQLAGWNNKMFVPAAMCQRQIRITDINVERLQDINVEDCYEEGIVYAKWRQFPKPDSREYIDHDIYTLDIYKESILDPWAPDDPDAWCAKDPQTAFHVLIRKMMGVKKWESNPYVFAYSFKLIK